MNMESAGFFETPISVYETAWNGILEAHNDSSEHRAMYSPWRTCQPQGRGNPRHSPVTVGCN